LFWYSAGEAEADPGRFLQYLLSAFRERLLELPDLPFTGDGERHSQAGSENRQEAVDSMVNALHAGLRTDSLLVIDDYHLVAQSLDVQALLERFLTYMPLWLHVVISTRYPLDLAILPTWKARGEVLEVGKRALAFGTDEIEALFRDVYACPLEADEIAALADRTEGWPIALQLVWQGIREHEGERGEAQGIGESRPGRRTDDLLARGQSLHTLFDYLAKEVIGSQPNEIKQFLLDTSVLRTLTLGACDAVYGVTEDGGRRTKDERGESAAILRRLVEMDLFVVDLSGEGSPHYRYHHLFHEFLRQQSALDPAGDREKHERAARYYARSGQYEEAIYH
jgi:ATP/maltotriose-dependent transcriptional regulator MalT